MNRFLNTPLTEAFRPAAGLGFLTALLLLAALFIHTPAMAADAIGSVDAAMGDCHIIRGNDTLTAAPGLPVVLDDEVTTGPGSELKIVFVDETVLTLSESSRAAIDSYVYSDDAANLLFKFSKGTFRTITGGIVKRNPEGFNMETPLASIGIRGSDVYAVVAPDGEETGALHLGENHALEVKTSMQTVRITESGMRVKISPTGIIFTPTRIPPSMFNSMLNLGSAAPAAPAAPEATAAPATKSAPVTEKKSTSPTLTKPTTRSGTTTLQKTAPTLQKTVPQRTTPNLQRTTPQRTTPTVTPNIAKPVLTPVTPTPTKQVQPQVRNRIF